MTFATLAPTFGASPGVLVNARYNVRVAHIETVGTLFNGTQEVGSGSGLLLGDKFVVTNNHVIPPENNYRELKVNIRLKSRNVAPLRAVAVLRDPGHDLALLELQNPVTDVAGRRCPMPVILSESRAPVGTELFVLGFPVDQDLTIANGLISNHSAERGRWLTNTLLNPGNSGGPAFDENGALVGIAVGGIVSFDTGGGTRANVTGVNIIIPLSQFVESPLFSNITRLPVDRRCWKEDEILVSATSVLPGSSEITSPIGEGGLINGNVSGSTGHTATVALPVLPLPDRINRSFAVSETKDDHPVALAPHSRKYERRFEAEQGYRVIGCIFSSASANNSHDEVCNVQAGGTTAVFEFRLESGPAVDRWRGWWGGTVTLQQELVGANSAAHLTRSFNITETKDDHPSLTNRNARMYSRRLAADPGYVITSCNWASSSAAHYSDEKCTITESGAAANFEFRLESGPQVDRWRGWWTGTVTLGQDKTP